MKRGPKLATKVYQKLTHTRHNFFNRARVKSQDKKDSDKEIKDIRHDLMLNEYPQEYITSILKPSSSSHIILQKQYIRAQSLSHMLRVLLRNLTILETGSM
jgi:hypothetical protein